MSPEQQAIFNAATLLKCLEKFGVTQICFSPGFRSTPLVVAANLIGSFQLESHIDERGAAFYALGMAKTLKKPTAIFCTSGTAVANFMPAVLEAFYSHVPLVVITSDRPQELVGIGANQTMQQRNFFGMHVRSFAQIDAIPITPGEKELIASTIHQSIEPIPGPVHINIAFSEPFLPTYLEAKEIVQSIQVEKHTYPKQSFLNINTFFEAQNLFTAAKRPIIAIGPTDLSTEEKKKIYLLAKKFNWPIFAETSSGFASALPRVNAFFHFEKNNPELTPDFIFRIGVPLTSKSFSNFLDKHPQTKQLILDEPEEKRDPNRTQSTFIAGNKAEWLEKLAVINLNASNFDSWTAKIKIAHEAIEKKLSEHLHANDLSEKFFTEWHFHQLLHELVPNGANLFIGNSMPIRDFDSVANIYDKNWKIFSNRGLSGIDGMISSALGMASVNSGHPNLLILGDLSALHDLTALSLAARLSAKNNLTICILNNSGGEIFRTVATAAITELEDQFTTPQKVDFEKIAAAFALPYKKAKNADESKVLLTADLASSGIKIIEIVFSSPNNTKIRKDFWSKL